MISLAAVEALAAEAAPGKELVVVAVPDARKGEHTVLLTTDASLTREVFSRHARANGAPELMVPTEIMVVDKHTAAGHRQAGLRGSQPAGAGKSCGWCQEHGGGVSGRMTGGAAGG